MTFVLMLDRSPMRHAAGRDRGRRRAGLRRTVPWKSAKKNSLFFDDRAAEGGAEDVLLALGLAAPERLLAHVFASMSLLR